MRPARGVLALAVALGACGGPAPLADGALFRDARALAATPDGTLWVVDAEAVLALRAGLVVGRVGGVGTGADAFLDPVDVDPTNGQTIFVADRAAGAVLQFTAEGRLATTYPIYDVDPARPVRQTGGPRERTRAQPVAVAAGPDGALYVADAGRRHVLKLDAEGAVERVLGAGALVEPVGLAVADDGTLWVADAGRGVLLSFDPFGAPGVARDLPAALGRLAAVAASGGRLVAVGDAGVVGLGPDGASAVVPAPGLRGAALVGGRLAGLTPTRLVDLGDAGLD